MNKRKCNCWLEIESCYCEDDKILVCPNCGKIDANINCDNCYDKL